MQSGGGLRVAQYNQCERLRGGEGRTESAWRCFDQQYVGNADHVFCQRSRPVAQQRCGEPTAACLLWRRCGAFRQPERNLGVAGGGDVPRSRPGRHESVAGGNRCGGNGRWSRRLLAVTTERSRGIHCCRMGRECWHVVCDFGRWSFDQQVRGGSVMRARAIRQWSRNRQRPGERRRLGAGCASSVDTGSGRSDADDSGNLQGVARASRWNQLDIGECIEPHARRKQCAGVPVEQHAGARSGCNGCGLRTRR